MRFQDILTSALDKIMYEKVHHNLKKKKQKRPTKVSWPGEKSLSKN